MAILISIEGSDGVGKKTQTDMLAKYLVEKGKRVASVSIPRYGETLGGKLLSEVLKSERAENYNFSTVEPKIASMLYAMDRGESIDYLNDLISNNDVIIFDRYTESNLLHQGGKLKTEKERKEFAEWAYRLENEMLGLPKTNLVIYLHIPAWLSMQRAENRAVQMGGKVDAAEADEEYIINSHNAGMYYAKIFNWEVVDGMAGGVELSKEYIHGLVVDKVNKHFKV